MIKREFKNEVGNLITVKIKNKPGIGENHKTGERVKFSGVSVVMIGPRSMSENNITDVEAVELYRALGKFIRQNKL